MGQRASGSAGGKVRQHGKGKLVLGEGAVRWPPWVLMRTDGKLPVDQQHIRDIERHVQAQPLRRLGIL